MSNDAKDRYFRRKIALRPVDHFAAAALSGILASEYWSRVSGYVQSQGQNPDEVLVEKAYALGRLMAVEREKYLP